MEACHLLALITMSDVGFHRNSLIEPPSLNAIKATVLLSIGLLSGMTSHAAITSKTLTPSTWYLNEGDEIVISLSISSSYTGDSEGIYSLTANVDWLNPDLPWPA